MDREQGTGAKQATLLSRWLAPPPPGAEVKVDPRALLADVEAALAAAYSPAAVAGLLAPIREALETPEDERDPAKLGPAFELVEDVLEAAALAAA